MFRYKKNNILSVLTTDISSNIFLTPINTKTIEVFATTFITHINVDIHIKIMNKLEYYWYINKVFSIVAILNFKMAGIGIIAKNGNKANFVPWTIMIRKILVPKM